MLFSVSCSTRKRLANRKTWRARARGAREAQGKDPEQAAPRARCQRPQQMSPAQWDPLRSDSESDSSGDEDLLLPGIQWDAS